MNDERWSDVDENAVVTFGTNVVSVAMTQTTERNIIVSKREKGLHVDICLHISWDAHCPRKWR